MPNLARKRSYQPYVPDFLGLCERNYAQLLPLLPAHREVGASVTLAVTPFETYQIRIIELARFTTTIRIEHLSEQTLRWLRPEFDARIYHDAQVAEVIACQQVRRFKAVYDYPNADMLQPDEKRQINLLLRDWLTLCHRRAVRADFQFVPDQIKDPQARRR